MDSACRCNSRNSFITDTIFSFSAATSREWADACCWSCLCSDATVRCRGRTYRSMRKKRRRWGNTHLFFYNLPDIRLVCIDVHGGGPTYTAILDRPWLGCPVIGRGLWYIFRSAWGGAIQV